MSRKYFGTDGIRGRVGKAPMTPDFALKLGWAAGMVLGGMGDRPVLIGKDTRRSGYLFESALEAGLSAAGMQVGLLGPVPTPAVAMLTVALGAQAGVVISASHNPHQDNGVKLFSASGDKLSDEIEDQIEACLERDFECVAPARLGMVRRVDDARERYVKYCLKVADGLSLEGLRIVIDCANGAAYWVAPEVFRRLGADLVVIGDRPDGFNINRGCGSTHLDNLCEAVRAHGADVGIAFDGDADRCLMADAAGNAIDGDQTLYVIARHLQATGRLRGSVVGTLMSNLGLEQAIRAIGLGFERAKVGDRHVLERLKSGGGNLGGESSGHTLCLDWATTGDGIVTAIQVLAAMLYAKAPLAEVASGMTKCPQVLINVRAEGQGQSAREILRRDEIRGAQRRIEERLGTSGRVLLRASGTEPLIRVMVEASDPELTRSAAEELADDIRAVLASC